MQPNCRKTDERKKDEVKSFTNSKYWLYVVIYQYVSVFIGFYVAAHRAYVIWLSYYQVERGQMFFLHDESKHFKLQKTNVICASWND